MTTSFVAYYRVSTQRQGQSGLGLEAQKTAVLAHVAGREIIEEYTEVESGKKADRPELRKAIALARKHKATLIIAKLDRLARNVRFIAELMESDVDFVACDLPTANKLTIQIMAAIAEHERDIISERTKASLAAAKERGTVLGAANPKIQPAASLGRLRGQITITRKANQQAQTVMGVVEEIRGAGITTLQGVADALNARGIRTARGNVWHPQSVSNVIKRASRAA
jgi:DNA invertase Pin-like site-specific DNA recombinase